MKVNRPKSIHGVTLPSFLQVESFKSIVFLPVKVDALKSIDATLPSFLQVESHFCILRKSSEGLKYRNPLLIESSSLFHYSGILVCFLLILIFGAFDL